MLAVLLLSVALQQSDTVFIREARCSRCSIEVDSIATIGDREGPGMVTARAVVAQDASGRFLVTHSLAPSQVNIFSPTGQFVRSFGRNGMGPGEYGRIWKIAPFDSGILIYDDRAKRSSRLTPEFEFVETRPSPETPLSVVVRPDGSGVMSAIVASGDLRGYQHHEFDAAGRRTRSGALNPMPFLPGRWDFFERDVSEGVEEGSYWSSQRIEYAFERCQYGSATCTRFVRQASWFPRPIERDVNEQTGDKPPLASLWGVWQEDERYLWTLVRVPDPEWKSAVESSSGRHFTVHDWNGYVDSLVECIDLTSGQVVASIRIDHALQRFFGDGLTWYHREDDEGNVSIEVVRFSMTDSRRE